MRYIAVGFAFGLVWAAVQYNAGDVTAPAALAASVVLCTAFGALLWGLRALVLRLRRRR